MQLRADLVDLLRLGVRSMILPQPGQYEFGSFSNRLSYASGMPVCIDRQRRASRGVDADADYVLGRDAFLLASFLEHALTRFRAGFVIARMLPGQIRIAIADHHARHAVRIVENARRQFPRRRCSPSTARTEPVP